MTSCKLLFLVLLLTGIFSFSISQTVDASSTIDIWTCFDRYETWNIVGTTQFYKMFGQGSDMKRCVFLYENSLIEGKDYEKNFVDLIDKPLVRNTPQEFTPDWYLNAEYDFALKFPGPVEENWEIKESPWEEFRVFFLSKNTDAILELLPTFVLDAERIGFEP